MNRYITQHPKKKDHFVYYQNMEEHLIKKTKPEVSELYQSTSKDVIILGGAPTLEEDFNKLLHDNLQHTADCIFVSCNHHGFKVLESEEIDYLCFLDHPKTTKVKDFQDAIFKNQPYKKISTLVDYTDFYCVNQNPIDLRDTGMFAVWFGCYLTTGNVHMCGFNLRQDVEGSDLKPKYGRWKLAWPKFYKPSRIIPVSGPLVELSLNPPYVCHQIIDYPKTDRDIIVIGGARNAEEDFNKLHSEGAIIISANHHAFNFCNPDIMVFMDDPESEKRSQWHDIVEDDEVLKISYFATKYSKYFCCYSVEKPSTSGHLSTWLASYITTGKIYLCGFDLYEGGDSDLPDETAVGWGGPSMSIKLLQWVNLFKLCPNKDINPVSGRLKDLFSEEG